MKKSRKILSLALALVMIFGAVSIGFTASARANYKNENLVQSMYDNHGAALLTSEQHATILVDMVDELLPTLGLPSMSILGLNIELGSINGVISTIESLDSFWGGGLIGDLGNVKAAELKDLRRPGTTDFSILYALFGWLNNSDNKGVIIKLIRGTISFGIAGSFIPLDIYEGWVQDLIGDMLGGGSLDDTLGDLLNGLLGDLLPGLTLNLSGSGYDLIEDAIKGVYNGLLVDLLNSIDMEATVGEGGIGETLAGILNTEFEVQPYNFTSAPLVDQLNDLLISLANTLLNTSAPGYPTFVSGGKENIAGNIEKAADFIIGAVSDEDLSGMILEQKIALAGKAIVEAIVPHMTIDYTGIPVSEQLEYLLFAGLQEYAASQIPDKIYTYTGATSFYAPAGDLLATALNRTFGNVNGTGTYNKKVPLNGDIWQALNYLFDFLLSSSAKATDFSSAFGYKVAGVLNNAGTLTVNLSGGRTETFRILSLLVSKLLPANTLPAAYPTVESLIMSGLLDNILDLDFTSFLTIFDKRTETTNSLNLGAMEYVILVVRNLLDMVVGHAGTAGNGGYVIPAVKTLDALINTTNLPIVVQNLIETIQPYRTGILAAALPLISSLLGTSGEQTLGDGSILSPDKVVLSSRNVPSGNYVTLRNNSDGINRAFYSAWNSDPSSFHQDALYKMRVISLTSSASTVTVAAAAGNIIDGGEQNTYQISGSLAADGVVKFTVQYYMLDEFGNPTSAKPYEAVAYTYMTGTAADTATVSSGTTRNLTVTLPQNTFATYKNLSSASGHWKHDTLWGSNAQVLSLSISSVSPAAPGIVMASPQMDIPSLTVLVNTNAESDFSVYSLANGYGADNKPAPGVYTVAIAVKAMQGTNTGINTTMNTKLYLYEDYDLPELYTEVVAANYQRSNFSADADAAWNELDAAMTQAVAAINKTMTTSNFSSRITEYEPAYNRLLAAREALLEYSEEASTDDCVAAAEAFWSNYDGIDYEGYTYARANAKANDCAGLDSQENVTTAQVTEALRLLELMESRMIKKPVADATQLSIVKAKADAANYVESDYSADSWAAYQAAYQAAKTEIARAAQSDTEQLQSEVNGARIDLLLAMKNLSAASLDLAALIEALDEASQINPDEWTQDSYEALAAAVEAGEGIVEAVTADPYSGSTQEAIGLAAQAILDAIDGLEPVSTFTPYITAAEGATINVNRVKGYISGVTVSAAGAAETYTAFLSKLDGNGGTLEVRDLNDAPVTRGGVGTGYSVVCLYEGVEVDRMYIVVYGDINGDGRVNATDRSFLSSYAAGEATALQMFANPCVLAAGYVDSNDRTKPNATDASYLKTAISANTINTAINQMKPIPDAIPSMW